MDYLKEVFTKKQKKWLIISGFMAVVFFGIILLGLKMVGSQTAQSLAGRWSKDTDWAQISVFFSDTAYADEDTVKELNFNVDKQLDTDSVSPDREGARRRLYAYSAGGEVGLSAGDFSKTYKAVGVGGDFFMFHPFELISGSFFDDDNVMKDLVVLDQDAAWDLFGSYDIVGREVYVGETRHIVSGVIRRDDSRLDKLAGNNESTVYLSYESLFNHGSITYLNNYEVLIPNSVRQYARNLVESNIPVPEGKWIVVENTGRFKWTRLIVELKSLSTRSMNSKAVIYPFWENMARGMEDRLFPLVVIDLLIFLFIFVNLWILIRRMWKKRRIHFKDVKNFAERIIEKRREIRKRKKEEGEYI